LSFYYIVVLLLFISIKRKEAAKGTIEDLDYHHSFFRALILFFFIILAFLDSFLIIYEIITGLRINNKINNKYKIQKNVEEVYYLNKQNIKNRPLNNKYKISQIQFTILSKMKPNNRMQQIECVDKMKIRGQEKPDNPYSRQPARRCGRA
jgi:hypothetical protein